MNAPAKFDRLARPYRWMEYFSFGSYLHECRKLRLEEMALCKRALVYGDGDGRFLAELVRRAPEIQATAVDASSKMLHQLARRLPGEAQVRLVHADALEYAPAGSPGTPFDLVVSHFFLDCFNEAEIASLLAHVNAAVEKSALWVISDFAIPLRMPGRLMGWWIVHGLYIAFGLLTGLKTRRLPDHARVLRESGWMLEDRRELLWGVLTSERWRRSPSP
ncbi:MAG TPA: class I SAM-dependent methyltransferase [Acidobacteriaceae bacterium]|nr:class I SAM-dependent methyltransferase [Acidobacteriaceae bacterium]